jgi:LPXTG-site transpeptidase (sortase) family protein
MKSQRTILALFSTVIVMILIVVPALAAPGDTTLVSANLSGGVGNAQSYGPDISADGDFVGFNSLAINLVGDTDSNLTSDVFLRQISTGTTVLVSQALGGGTGNGESIHPTLNADGSQVAFISSATNLVSATDTNAANDIFVRNMNTNTTRLVSVDTTRESAGNRNSEEPSISHNGSRIAFTSYATNLVVGDANARPDIFVNDLAANTTRLVSVSTIGTQGNDISARPSISGDGGYVAFVSTATNLTANDDNGSILDIFVRNLTSSSTVMASVASNGTQSNGISGDPSISSDGTYVAFSSDGTNLVPGDTNNETDIFVRDMVNGTTTRVSVSSEGNQGDDYSISPSISPDGRYIAFESNARNLVHNDTNGSRDIFVHDMTTGMTTRVSMRTGGIQGNSTSLSSSVSSGGTYVTFTSYSTNLATGDSNGFSDIFLNETDRTAPTVVFGVGSVPASSGAVVTTAPITLRVMFSENVFAGGGQYAANSAQNYMLVGAGPNGEIDTPTDTTAICSEDHAAAGDDVNYFTYLNSYNSTTHIATLTFESNDKIRTAPLANGRYELFVCGVESISDLAGNVLNTRANTGVPFTVGPAGTGGGTGGTSSSETIAYPATGFAPGRATNLPAQTVKYSGVGDMQLEIPTLGVQMPVVEVPEEKGKWDVSWLGQDAGWLSGSAFPTWAGNSVLTGHVYDANGKPGPFVNLETLKWGDRILIHAWGQDYIYEVRSVDELVNPKDTRFLTKHEELPWLTLVTCKGFDEKSNTYLWRTVVRSVQVEVK